MRYGDTVRSPPRPPLPSGHRTLLAGLGIPLFLALIALSAWAAADDHLPGDVTVGHWIQAHDPLGQDGIDFFRDVGSTQAAAVTILLVIVALLLARRRRMALAAGALLLGLVLQWLLKELIDRPRTSILVLDQRTGFDSPSFPSGHAMSSVIVGTLLIWIAVRPATALPWPLRLLPGLWGLMLAIISPWISVASGVHWPSDSLGGVAWALAVLLPGLWALETARRRDAARPPVP